jgi:hypothetical protein
MDNMNIFEDYNSMFDNIKNVNVAKAATNATKHLTLSECYYDPALLFVASVCEMLVNNDDMFIDEKSLFVN